MRTIITISGAANCNWNGVRPVLKLRSSQSGAPTGIGRHAAGNETKRFIETVRTKRFFKLFVFLSFLAKSRAIVLFYRARSRVCICIFYFPFGIFIALLYCIIECIFAQLRSPPVWIMSCDTLASYHYKGRSFRISMKKCAIFFLSKKEVVSILVPCHFYPAYVKSLFYARPYLKIIS